MNHETADQCETTRQGSGSIAVAYAWSEVSALEGSELARRERDRSLEGLSPADQEAAIGRAHAILAQVERETAVPKQG